MRTRIWWIGLAVLNSVVAQVTEIQLGKPAPELAAKDWREVEVRLSDYRQKKIVVVMAPGRGNLVTVEEREDARRRLEALDVVALFLAGEAKAATVLIDSGGVVRRVHAGRALAGDELAEFVSLWRQGKAVFGTACARCHGEDGALDICLDVKPLVGIGRRLSAAEIRDRLRMGELNEAEVVVRGQFFKRKEVDALIAYVSGL